MTGKYFLAVAVASGLVACGGSGGYGTGPGPVPPPTGTVLATPGLAFNPGTVRVNTGDEVTFSFGSVAHNVFFNTANGAPTDIDGNNANVTVKRTFPTAGTFTYTCHIHPSMTGTVIVS